MKGLALLVPVLFSVVYFAAVLLRASAKFFWFDELCTVYICRLPTFSDSWKAVLHGADYNPPLFYVIERTMRAVLGDGLVSMRLPSMMGLWVFCLCLYSAVKRRTGLLGGVVALLFPLCTIAGYYACEARPHAIVLGFCGLAILFWQRGQESTRPVMWTALFGLSLAAAFLTHCYAVVIAFPFVFAELWRTVEQRRIRVPVWLAMLLPAIMAFFAYLPLLRAYRDVLLGTGFAYIFRAAFWQVHFFYLLVFTPFIAIAVCGIVLLALHRPSALMVGRYELCVYIGFAMLPFAAVVFAMAVHGPFIPRYFLATVAGIAALVGLAFGTEGRWRWTSLAFIAVMCVGLGRDLSSLVSHRIAGTGETMEEPAVHIFMNTTPGKPLEDYTLLQKATGDAPVLLAEPMDYLYLVQYDPALIPRLYYASWAPDEANYRLYQSVRTWCHVDYNSPTTYPAFLPAHAQFYLFGDLSSLIRLSELSKGGAKIEHFEWDQHHWIARMSYHGAD